MNKFPHTMFEPRRSNKIIRCTVCRKNIATPPLFVPCLPEQHIVAFHIDCLPEELRGEQLVWAAVVRNHPPIFEFVGLQLIGARID